MKTKTAAIEHARANVCMSRAPGGQWQINTQDADFHTWRQGIPRNYGEARAHYAQALVDSARDFLGLPPAQHYCGMKWTDFLT